MDKPLPTPVPPKTEYELSQEQFRRYIEKRSFKVADWFYSKSGAELETDEMFKDLQLDVDEHYIVFINADLRERDDFFSIKDTLYTPSFIFVDCLLPAITIDNNRLGDLVLVRTHIEGEIRIANDSSVQRIRMAGKSRCSDISIDNSLIHNIIIVENSEPGNISLDQEGVCGGIIIDTESHCGDIWLYSKARCGSISLDNKSAMGGLTIEKDGSCIRLSVLDKSQVGHIRVGSTGRCNSIDINYSSKGGDILIEGNTEVISIQGRSQCGDIKLEGGGKINDLNVSGGSKVGDIKMHDKSQSGCISILYDSECRDVKIYGRSQCTNIYINNGKCGIVDIEHNSSLGNISLENSSCCKYIDLQNGSKCEAIQIVDYSLIGRVGIYKDSYVGRLEIAGNSLCPDLEISDGKVDRIKLAHNYGRVSLHGAIVSLMQISNCHLTQLSWQAGTKVELYIENCFINHLNLHKTSLLKDSVLSIVASSIYVMQLQELLVQGQLILRDISVPPEPFEWKPDVIIQKTKEGLDGLLHGIYNTSEAFLHKQIISYKTQLQNFCYTKPLFRIVNSSLGKTEITGSDLRNFNFEYRDSKLLEAFISGTQLPREKIEIYKEPSQNCLPDKIYFEQKISIYNQLKRIFENQGDIVEGTWYHSKAMANQQRLLELLYKEKAGRCWSEEAFDLFNFRLNKLSNNHGESWRQALCFSIGVFLFIYTLYFVSINWGSPFSWNGTGDFFGNFFSFVDLTHKIDFMVEKDKVNWVAKILDFLGRIATGYCLYQFIAVFRRHGKRG